MTSDRQRALISMSSLSSFLAYSVTMTNTQKVLLLVRLLLLFSQTLL